MIEVKGGKIYVEDTGMDEILKQMSYTWIVIFFICFLMMH